MTNEVVYAWGTPKILESNGAAITNAQISQANDASYSVVSDGGSYPDALFVLRVQFSTVTGIENRTISLHARPLNIDGTNHAPAPTATFIEKFLGSFVLSSGTDQYLSLVVHDLPKEADYYLINNSGQTVSAGWTLKVTPRTYKPST